MAVYPASLLSRSQNSFIVNHPPYYLLPGLVDPLMAETWISGYVDLLRRFGLWTTATEILHLAAPYMIMSPETTSLSQQSTLIRCE